MSAIKTLVEQLKLSKNTVVNRDNKMTKVFVSGCFDVLHSGHIRIFEEAAQYGDLYVPSVPIKPLKNSNIARLCITKTSVCIWFRP